MVWRSCVDPGNTRVMPHGSEHSSDEMNDGGLRPVYPIPVPFQAWTTNSSTADALRETLVVLVLKSLVPSGAFPFGLFWWNLWWNSLIH